MNSVAIIDGCGVPRTRPIPSELAYPLPELLRQDCRDPRRQHQCAADRQAVPLDLFANVVNR